MSSAIAIVGMACLYPDARSPVELWENALAQRRAFRPIPPERLSLNDYGSADLSAPDRTYAKEAALIEGYEFDRVRYRVAGSTYRSADLAHWLALDIAAQALMDAGYEDGNGLPKESTGVLIGNTLTGEFSRANTLRLRWPYVRKVVETSLVEEGWSDAERRPFLEALEERFKAPFAPIGEESLAGGLANTIAGRICNYFDLNGGGYTVDGACASSLLAVSNACSALVAGDLDVALAGGVDLSLDPFELVGFAKIGALTQGAMRVYDAQSAGFLPGEGCGVIVLMRHADAVAENRSIYAVIRGWGISSDGCGGITRPEVDGQLIAVRRAYKRAGFGIHTVGYFEGHGTGTAVGDATELRMLARARAESDPAAPPAVISSIKANIGHTKAAAGVAGLIKATMALTSRVLPPATGCESPHAELSGNRELSEVEHEAASAKLTALSTAQSWPDTMPLRAGVSAMGFGGINTHVVLANDAPRATAGQRQALYSSSMRATSSVLDVGSKRESQSHDLSAFVTQDAELFLMAGLDIADLTDQIVQLLALVPRLSRAEMTDLAAALQLSVTTRQNQHADRERAAIVASAPVELASGLQKLLAWLNSGTTDKQDTQQGIFLGTGQQKSRIGFLFPGQGTAVYDDGGALERRFEFIRAFRSDKEATIRSTIALSQSQTVAVRENGNQSEHGATETAVAQPAIVTSTLLALEVLEHFGIEANCAVGHSLGELSALHWAGAMDADTLLRVASARGRLMTELSAPTGTMAYIGADGDSVSQLLNGDPVNIACFNAPARTIVAGESSAVATIINRAQVCGLNVSNIAVSHAFHSPLMAPAAQPLFTYLSTEALTPLQKQIVSTVTGDYLTQQADIRTLLQRQVTEPVRFMEAVTKLAADSDLLIEVGPGLVLSGLSRECVDIPVVGLDAGGDSLTGLLAALGAAYARGAPIRHDRLFSDRFSRPFDLNKELQFFINPCERVPAVEQTDQQEAAAIDSHTQTAVEPVDVFTRYNDRAPQTRSSKSQNDDHLSVSGNDVLKVVRQLVADRVELPLSAVGNEDRLLGDLHLNSISVSQLVSEAARTLGVQPPIAPTEYANVTVATVAETLAEIYATGNATSETEADQLVGGVDSWTRAFSVDLVERTRPQNQNTKNPGIWNLFTAPGYPLAQEMYDAFTGAPGDGVVVCLPPEPDKRHLKTLLAGVQAVCELNDDARFILIQHGGGAAALVRTLQMERPKGITCVIDLPADHSQAPEWAVSEALTATGYSEVHYDAEGKRHVPVLRLLQLDPVQYPERLSDTGADAGSQWIGHAEYPQSPLPLDATDVLLVTGGGKGITAECALALAQETGIRLALMGRSLPEHDAELASNLDRMTGAGINFQYVAVDITHADEVRDAVEKIERRVGKITGILHGAARNVPCLLSNLDIETFEQTLAPKIQGAENLLAAIGPEQLRLFVSFGSIIARTGLPGEADYGLANEWLVRLTEQLQQAHPSCRCLAIEWSVWSGAGMGDRLGTLDALMRQGISPIPLDDGVAMFLRLLRHAGAKADSPVATVVTGRFGTPPTLGLEAQELPFWRFLEETRVHYPEIELVVDAVLDQESDPYLADHVYANERLLPAVVGLEAMAQAAMALLGTEQLPDFENAQFKRPVIVPEGGNLTIRLAALVRKPNLIEVSLRSEESGFQTDHFRVMCRFGGADDNSAQSCSEQMQDSDPESMGEGASLPQLSLEPQRDLYGGLLFHTGRFQRVRSYRQIQSKRCVADIALDNSAWFGRYMPANLVLGDPGARDAIIHAIQVCVPHATLLPIGIERLIPGKLEGSEPLQVRAIERARHGGHFVYDVNVVNANGELVERWEGLSLRTVNSSDDIAGQPAALLGPFLERQLAERFRMTDLNIGIEMGASMERQLRSDLAIQRAVGRPTAVWRRPDGKPEVAGDRMVSAAHAGDLTLAVASAKEVGCDIEAVTHRTEKIWRELLGNDRFQLACLISQEANESLDASATRVWNAGECMKKVGAATHAPLSLQSVESDSWVLLSSGRFTIASTITNYQDAADPVAIAIAISEEESKPLCQDRQDALPVDRPL